MGHSILVVDDDFVFRQSLSNNLKKRHYKVMEAGTGREGLGFLEKETVDCVLLDLRLPDTSGIEVMGKIKQKYPNLPVIMISASGETDHVVKAMKFGASNYLKKPLSSEELEAKIKTQLQFMALAAKKEKEALEGSVNPLSQILGQSEPCKLLIQEISKIANSDATVLLRGGSGTGKSMIAEIIHRQSVRKKGPFVTLNCTAIPETLLESELFGHVKGSFTGAHRDRTGRFKSADTGTIFLDEIGEISTDIQVKLLRLLQAKEFEPLGSLKTVKVDVRIITATNRDLEKAIRDGSFREDLFYRLNVLPVYVPSLRERQEDIPLLAEHYIKKYAKNLGKEFEPLDLEVRELLMDYAWPGNIRELQNVMERAVTLAPSGSLKISDFKLNQNPLLKKSSLSDSSFSGEKIHSLKELEYQQLVKALKEHSGNISRVARSLNIARDTVYRRLKKYQIALKTS